MVCRSELTGCVEVRWNWHKHCKKCSNHNSQLQKQLSCYIPSKVSPFQTDSTIMAEAVGQDMPLMADIFMQRNQSMAPATSEALIDSNDKVFAAMLQPVTASVARCFGDGRWGCGAS